jgi:hypothetical protein
MATKTAIIDRSVVLHCLVYRNGGTMTASGSMNQRNRNGLLLSHSLTQRFVGFSGSASQHLRTTTTQSILRANNQPTSSIATTTTKGTPSLRWKEKDEVGVISIEEIKILMRLSTTVHRTPQLVVAAQRLLDPYFQALLISDGEFCFQLHSLIQF